MLTKRNTKIQGLVGLGSAIQYFTTNDYIVSVPLNDSQGYDLVVENGAGLKKIQIKTCRRKSLKSNSWSVGLRTSGGSRNTHYEKNLNKSECDFLFILTEDGRRWLIPIDKVEGNTGINIGLDKYREFLV